MKSTKTLDNLELITNEVISIVTEAAGYVKNERLNFKQENVELKNVNDFVSYVDKETERMLVHKLSVVIPNAGFLTEESTTKYQKGFEYYWIIDPLDGTTNFIHNSTPYAISVALFKNNEPLIGVIYEITRDEIFYAWKGSKAYLNGNVIRVSNVHELSEAIISTGIPHDYVKYKFMISKTYDYFIQHTHGLRQSGSAATDLAYVACGRYDGRFEYGLKPWDIAAGILIVQQAGGYVFDFSGNKDYFTNGEVVAANSCIMKEFQEILRVLFPDLYCSLS